MSPWQFGLRHVLDYAEREQGDVQMIGLMLDQQTQRKRRLEAATAALTARPSAQDLLTAERCAGSEQNARVTSSREI